MIDLPLSRRKHLFNFTARDASGREYKLAAYQNTEWHRSHHAQSYEHPSGVVEVDALRELVLANDTDNDRHFIQYEEPGRYILHFRQYFFERSKAPIELTSTDPKAP